MEVDLRRLGVISYLPSEDGKGRAPALSRGWLLAWIEDGLPWQEIVRIPAVVGVREAADGRLDVVSLDTVAAIRVFERTVWAAIEDERRGDAPQIDLQGACELFGDVGGLLAVARRAIAARENAKAPSGDLPSGLRL